MISSFEQCYCLSHSTAPCTVCNLRIRINEWRLPHLSHVHIILAPFHSYYSNVVRPTTEWRWIVQRYRIRWLVGLVCSISTHIFFCSPKNVHRNCFCLFLFHHILTFPSIWSSHCCLNRRKKRKQYIICMTSSYGRTIFYLLNAIRLTFILAYSIQYKGSTSILFLLLPNTEYTTC